MKKHKKESRDQLMLYSALAQYASVTFAIQSRQPARTSLHALVMQEQQFVIVAAKPHPTAADIYFWVCIF